MKAIRSAATPHPRVLIVSLNRVNSSDQDSTAFLIRNLFGDWPRECLAQVFSAKDDGDDGFCSTYYQVGPRDRFLGSLFYRLKHLSGATDGGQPMEPLVAGANSHAESPLGRAMRLCGRWFMSKQIHEVAFPLKVSHQMASWLSSFGPDVIYATGYTLGFARLAALISQTFDIPLCIHWSDDWPTVLLREAPSVLRDTAYSPIIKHLVARAAFRWAFTPAMADEYRRRYGFRFQPVMNGDLPTRFPEPTEAHKANGFTVALCGGLGRGRWRSLIDLCEACSELWGQGLDCRVIVYATAMPTEAVQHLTQYSLLTVRSAPSHDELPKALTEADLLAIVEPFDPKSAADIRLSVTTKAHLFMLARRPILIYAPGTTGIAQYCRNERFGALVDTPDRSQLVETLASLLLSPTRRAELIDRAWLTALANHDIRRIRGYVSQELGAVVAR